MKKKGKSKDKETERPAGTAEPDTAVGEHGFDTAGTNKLGADPEQSD